MTASLNHFTPASGLVGGSLIGLSAATLLLCNGNVLGASSLASSFVATPWRALTDPARRWRLAFLAAFFLAARAYVALAGAAAVGTPCATPLGHVLGGLLVGGGTTLGNGCTSGHGICGLARRSARSLAAVLSFMATGMFVATCLRDDSPWYSHLRLVPGNAGPSPGAVPPGIGAALASLAASAALAGFLRGAGGTDRDGGNDGRKIVPAAAGGVLFALGLAVSGMTDAAKVLGFLDLKGLGDGSWDPTLAAVMGGGLAVSALSYEWVDAFAYRENPGALARPLGQWAPGGRFDVPTRRDIDGSLLGGAVLFGLGWALAGACPGPAIFLACAGHPDILFRWWPGFFVGSFLAHRLKSGPGSPPKKE